MDTLLSKLRPTSKGMSFCPNCGAKLSAGGAKFWPECGTNLQALISAQIPMPMPAVTTSKEERSTKAFELLRSELSKKAAELAKEIGDSLIEKWKASGKYPKRFGSVINTLVERAVPPLVEMKVRGVSWEDGEATEASEGKFDTSVSTSFPVELQTGIPLLGKITIKEVRLIMRGLVDEASGNVSQLRVGGLDLA